jgi:cob(I)alamin adenosyltransferase
MWRGQRPGDKCIHSMAKIYTRTGDAGETALFAGGRVRKDDLRIEAIGTIDEVNAAVGVVRMELARGGTAPAGLDDLLAPVQHRLFDLGAELATPQPEKGHTDLLRDSHVALLEAEIDRYDAGLEPLKAFILPGGCPAAAQLHLARCVCRRAERRLVELAAAQPVRPQVLGFINRLSDLLFVLARAANQANRVADVKWEQGAGGREQGAEESISRKLGEPST